MFQTFISRHNSNFFSDKLVLTSVTPASSAPVLQTPKATSSPLSIASLPVNAGNGGFLHCIQMDTSVNAANQVVSVGADIAFDADPKFFACLVRFESSSVPTTLPTAYDVYPLDGRHDGGLSIRPGMPLDAGGNGLPVDVLRECGQVPNSGAAATVFEDGGNFGGVVDEPFKLRVTVDGLPLLASNAYSGGTTINGGATL